MYNDLFSIGSFTVHGYGLMIAIGVIVALIVGEKRAVKKGLSDDEIFNLTFVALISGFLGAKLLYCIVEWKSFIKDPIEVLSGHGFVVYGGIIGGILGCLLYCIIRKLHFWRYFDVVLPSVAIAQGFGRIGCFLAGCCYGRETDSPFGIVFHDSNFAPNGVKLIPTQLISSAACFVMAAILICYARKDRNPGRVGALYFILYSVGRFFIEFLRNDYRGEIGILSTSQFISIFIFIIGIIIFAVAKPDKNVELKSEKDNDEKVSEE